MTTRILRFISLLSSLIVSISPLCAQEQTDDWNRSEQKSIYGLSLYTDLFGPVTSCFMDDRFDMSAGIDLDVCHTIYPTFEMGFARWDGSGDYGYVLEQPSDYSYTCRGTYYKIGAKFNLLNGGRRKKFTPMFYLAVKFAFSPSHFELNDVRVVSDAWDVDRNFDIGGRSVVKWAEFSAGLRYNIGRFFFINFECNLKEFATSKAVKKNVDNLNVSVHQSYAPGYGDICGSHWGVKYEVGFFFHKRDKAIQE